MLIELVYSYIVELNVSHFVVFKKNYPFCNEFPGIFFYGRFDEVSLLYEICLE